MSGASSMNIGISGRVSERINPDLALCVLSLVVLQ